MYKTAILSFLVCALGASASAAQGDPVPHLAAERLQDEERITLDGRLDEPAWARAVPATDFRQQEPVEGAAPSQPTEVRVVFSANSLYIGAELFDSDPSGIKGFQRRRDAGLGSDDRFMWVLDTFRDGRTGYFFEINPAGLLGDGLLRIGSGGSINKSWDGIWDVRVRRHERGWTAEIRIPFRTLNFDPRSDRWGINFQRTIRRLNEELVWSGHRRNQGLFLPINAGVLSGLAGISQGVGLEAKPYMAANHSTADGVADTGADLGLDLGYSVTPSLRLAMTVNTDFAETEVDDRQVNLTRFPLFFPERRQFFLEGSSIYNFAGSSGVNPFFSRRIGLVSGEPVPVQFGARLGGQAGAWDLGLLQVRTGAQGVVPTEDFSVARLRRNFLAQSSIGAVYTRRASGLTGDLELPDRHTYGMDLDLSTAAFLGNKNLQFEAFFAGHTESRLDEATTLGDRSARGIRLNYPNNKWQAHVSLREFGEAWNPAVGFAPRRGFRRLQPSVSWNPRPIGLANVRELQFQIFFENLTNLDGVLETRRLSAQPFGMRLNQGDNLGVEVANQFEYLAGPFEIAEGVVLAPGEYSFNDLSADFNSANQRVVSVNAEVQFGQFWSGTRRRAELGTTIRPSGALNLSAVLERQDVTLPEGAFATTLMRVNAAWTPTPFVALTNSLQYDNVSRVAGLNSRLRWILRPGSDFYFVYGHNWRHDDGRYFTLSRGATTKVNYTHRF
ncbi:MAG: DUF5916 domain-containing protein [Acidobacteriota bacterium]|nr:DUF5916 domain-containing protein [Acidobacteriota bacterium]